ncbi:hypothetical protein MIMGU_mgv1a016418mg [Erythranthe guttata]|uniref:Uncharacterized protein n=1 Tax=Erythranthe guttata TaxID=4155 RepID=A0A022QPP7_ERYGU|nr:hypothetical protein MIMGU_mgv1a016418mg [Erythranthe guttata]
MTEPMSWTCMDPRLFSMSTILPSKSSMHESNIDFWLLISRVEIAGFTIGTIPGRRFASSRVVRRELTEASCQLVAFFTILLHSRLWEAVRHQGFTPAKLRAPAVGPSAARRRRRAAAAATNR